MNTQPLTFGDLRLWVSHIASHIFTDVFREGTHLLFCRAVAPSLAQCQTNSSAQPQPRQMRCPLVIPQCSCVREPLSCTERGFPTHTKVPGAALGCTPHCQKRGSPMWHLKVSVSEADELTAFPLQLCPLLCPLWGLSCQEPLVTMASVTIYSQLLTPPHTHCSILLRTLPQRRAFEGLKERFEERRRKDGWTQRCNCPCFTLSYCERVDE